MSPRKLVLVLVISVVAAFWAVALIMIAADRRRIAQASDAELLGAIPVLKMHARRSFDSAYAILIAIDEAIQQSGDSSDLDRISQLARRMQRSEEDPIGIGVVTAGRQMLRIEGDGGMVDVGDRAYVTALADKPSGTLYIDAPLISRASARRVLPLVMRARPNPHGIDLIIAAIPSKGFEEAYQNLLISAPSIIGLLREDGLALHLTPDPYNSTGRMFRAYDPLKLVAANPPMTAFDAASSRAGAPLQRSAYAWVEPFPILVFAALDNRFIVDNWHRAALPKLGVAVVATILFGGLGYWLLLIMARRDAATARIRQAIHELNAANNAKRDFMARMSHELRTPLNAILGFSELIAEGMMGPLADGYRGYGRDIHKSGQHLLAMINQVLDITRIEAGEFQVDDKVLLPAEAVEEAAAMLKPLAEKRGIAIRNELDPALGNLRADPALLRQMLLNVLSNAIKFNPPGRPVRVWAEMTADGFALLVRDEGPGIRPERLAHIFEPFGRGNSYLAEENAGIGLGLPIVKMLIEMHGGSLGIETAPGEGTLMRLIFPVQRRVAPR